MNVYIVRHTVLCVSMQWYSVFNRSKGERHWGIDLGFFRLKWVIKHKICDTMMGLFPNGVHQSKKLFWGGRQQTSMSCRLVVSNDSMEQWRGNYGRGARRMLLLNASTWHRAWHVGGSQQICVDYQSLYNQCKSCVLNSALWGQSFLYIQMTFFKFSSTSIPMKFSRAEASLLLLSILSLILTRYLAYGRCWMNVVGWVNEGCIIKDSVSKYFWRQPAGPGFHCHLRRRLPINLGRVAMASLGCCDLFTRFA